ncbi:MAG: hypothetical protein QM346_10965 [Chloroflexota bacterium]|jgi:hypothetical protein|nr:hypothetical protein [Chloroflexota bacterium]
MSEGEQRIDLWRLSRGLLLFLVVPISAAIAGDFVFGVWPILTIAAVGVAFPVAGFVVIRTALKEMERVIRAVAPEENGSADETTGGAPSETMMDVASRGAQVAD